MLIWLGVVLFSILFNTICTFSWHNTAMSCSDNMCNTSHELCAGLALCCVLLWFGIGRLPGLIYWHWGNQTNCTIVSVPVKQRWRLWVNKSQELLKLMLCTQQSNKTLYKLMRHTIYHTWRFKSIHCNTYYATCSKHCNKFEYTCNSDIQMYWKC